MDEPSRPPPRSRGIYLLPNLLTTGGMFSGFYAILAAASGHFETACIAVFVAALFDGVDGRIARLTGTSTQFGVQYDSLADLVSFGMAPALVMYHWALSTLKLDGVPMGKAGWSAAFLYMACAALRLARFNAQVGVVDKRWFIGLASPAAAAVVVSFVWTMDHLGYSGEQLRYVALAVTVIAGLLMVSRLRYTSFKGGRSNPSPPGERVPFVLLLVVVLTIVALYIYPSVLLLAVTWLYALSGPALWAWNRLRRKPPASPTEAT
ncbi:MAG: CDP-diacylglycerol--serine O-phosphatidyltransferase [Proteobacteria bacterium]|nr:CDP-diacylglycerol--serine O-phosphatidyltransferase [Pseudomonadota bacterium]